MKRKIVLEDEIDRWIEEGRTYRWMADEYMRKYNLDVSPSLFSSYRYRKGLGRKISRDEELIPWVVERQHRWEYPLAMLRVEGRRREGRPLRESDARKVDSWKRDMQERGVVVHYDPLTEAGFYYVPKRPGVDNDLIRVPDGA